jgi:VanZ family protein
MKTLYSLAARLPHWAYQTVALSLYILMLVLGAFEPTVDALPGRGDFSKLYHLFFYFGLATLAWFGMRNASVRAVVLLVALAGAIDEIHQCFLPFRSPRITDVLIDTAAALLAAFLLQNLRRQEHSAHQDLHRRPLG